MKVYYHDAQDNEDKRLPHNQGVPVSNEELKAFGVLAFHFDDPEDVDKLAAERNYVSRDVVTISPTSFGSEEVYNSKLKSFYEEHIHEDEEIRYILDGAGYFDVRDKNDKWIRAYLEKGDLMILPAGIYHRFTLTTDDYIKAMRLFKEEPKWIAYARPGADSNAHRQQYLKEISA